MGHLAALPVFLWMSLAGMPRSLVDMSREVRQKAPARAFLVFVMSSMLLRPTLAWYPIESSSLQSGFMSVGRKEAGQTPPHQANLYAGERGSATPCGMRDQMQVGVRLPPLRLPATIVASSLEVPKKVSCVAQGHLGLPLFFVTPTA